MLLEGKPNSKGSTLPGILKWAAWRREPPCPHSLGPLRILQAQGPDLLKIIMIVLWVTEYSNIDFCQWDWHKGRTELGHVMRRSGRWRVGLPRQNIQEMTPELRSDGKEGPPEGTAGAIPWGGDSLAGVPRASVTGGQMTSWTGKTCLGFWLFLGQSSWEAQKAEKL